MNRRVFLEAGGLAMLGLAMGGCASGTAQRQVATGAGWRKPLNLVPVECSMDRIIRTTVGLRPHRDSGFLLEAERFDDKTVVHNFGHGGAGMSLSWGTASLAADLAVAHTGRRAAVLGCGIVGLTSARQLQRRGFDVTIYAMDLPPNTTSNMSFANFTPMSGLVSRDRWTPAWGAQFRRAVEIAYREHQLLVGAGYGVSWINEYAVFDQLPVPRASPTTPPDPAGPPSPFTEDNPTYVDVGSIVYEPGQHPFGNRYLTEHPTMRFEPSIYLDALMRDVVSFGGRIVVRRFDTPRDLMSLAEPIIVNCTGLGAKALFGDEELVPIKGQLTVLVPQPEVTYMVGGMIPRSDGIVLSGGMRERGDWSLEADEAFNARVVERFRKLFDGMRAQLGDVEMTALRPPAKPPRVESYLGRES